ncbi:MAG: von Willebrand factor type A domain-containing protein [Verrucomicrobiia bacterium]|jgi:Ca-activated chloride channel family protein
MKFQPDNPELTAYALGELDASETAAVAAAVENSADCRQAVEETRETAGLLTSALQTETCPALSTAQRDAINTSLTSAPKAPARSKPAPAQPSFLAAVFAWRPQFATVALWATACLVAVTGWALWLEVFCKTDRDRNDSRVAVVTAFTAPLNPKLATPLPLPPPPPGRQQVVSALKPMVVAKSFAPRPAMVATPLPSAAVVTDPLGAVVPNPVTINGGHQVNRLYAGRAASFLARSSSRKTVALPAMRLSQFSAGSRYHGQSETESYAYHADNPFLAVAEQPLSTFSIDVDTASYANVRRFLMQGSVPPRDAVRIEEMINYFTYDYVKPKGGEPFSVNIEAAGCPWNAGHRLVRIGLKGREVSAAKRPPCNLVFLLDVSGSMADANKLSLIKPAMRMLVEQLTENDRVGIVVYNQSARVVLSSTSGDRKQEIIDAIESLQANGSTNGGDGIRLAYDMATRHFVERGVNRVILCTDGDFNVGTTELAELTRLIEQKRQSGVFLSVLGFGAGNLKDATLERLADKGNGHYTYIDTFFEARKVLVEQMNATLVTIAKDVKIQVEFNPAKVAGYRLIGYEDRLLAKEDFNNDHKDAGEIGAGHTVTALYEIVPAGQPLPVPAVDPLKYQPAPKPAAPAAGSEELLTVKLRYKQPDGDKSALIEETLTDGGKSYGAASRDFKFAAAVAAFGMVLRDSPHKGNATLAGVLELAEESRGPDASGYRTEFLSLVKKAQALGKK